MAAAIIDVYRALDQWAPFDTQMDFDNAGFLVAVSYTHLTLPTT